MRFAVVAVIAGLGCRPTAHDAEPPPRSSSEPATAGHEVQPIPDAAVATQAKAIDPPAVAMVEAPIKWSDARAALTLTYRRQHSDPAAKDLTIAPRVIVLHYTAGSSAKGTREYMDNLEIEASRSELARAGKVNVSSHYLIDRDGTIYRLQPETRFARHCIGLNHIAIGIENVGDEKKWPLTDAQVAADVALVRKLAAEFPITHLIGHYEAMSFRNNAYYLERDPNYKNDKPDPGAAFMRKVRAEVADLKLSGL